jgi:hypothetical protein
MNNTFSMKMGGDIFIGDLPEKCPLCNVVVHTGLPITYHGLQAVFCCPNCDGVFIGYYSPIEEVAEI